MKIAFLGAGLMGSPMAKRLLDAGHEVHLYNRTKNKSEKLVAHGAIIADTVNAAVADGDCVILMLANIVAIENVLFSETTINLKDKTVIQMGTISPSESIELQKKVFQYGGEYLECPVLGSRTEAQDSKLILMVGATEEKFENWKKFLKVFGPNPLRVGGVGSAAALKLALNQLIAVQAVGFSFSLAMVKASGVDVKQFMDILRQSALYAPMFDKKLPNWLEDRYESPNFSLKHLLKDVELMISHAEEKHIATSHLEAIVELLQESMKNKLAEKDYSAVYKTIARKSS